MTLSSLRERPKPPDLHLYLPKKDIAPITPTPSSTCPIPHARTSILSRYESDDGKFRPIYRVRVEYLDDATTDGKGPYPEDDDGHCNGPREEIEEVDVSAILSYVSPMQLEQFENAEFRREREEELRLEREEDELLRQHSLDMLRRVVVRGSATRGRPSRGRGTGRGTGRGRGRPPRSHTMLDRIPGTFGSESEEVGTETARDVVPNRRPVGRPKKPFKQLGMKSTEQEVQDSSMQSDSDDHPSPNLMKSSFVANSALPSTTLSQRAREVQDSDTASSSSSTASRQLHTETFKLTSLPLKHAGSSSEGDHTHRHKRQKTSESPPISLSQFRSVTSRQPRSQDQSSANNIDVAEDRSDDAGVMNLIGEPSGDEEGGDGDEDEDEDVYVVEKILQHYDSEGVRYYLVKWQGYDEAEDWLSRDELAGANDVVKRYDKRLKRAR